MKKNIAQLTAFLVVAGLVFAVSSPAMGFCFCKSHVTKVQVKTADTVANTADAAPRIQVEFRDYQEASTSQPTTRTTRRSSWEQSTTPAFFDVQVEGFL